MTQIIEIITDASLLAGIGDLYNALDANQSALGLRVFNRMMDQWSAEETPLFNIIDGFTGAPTPGFVLTPGTAKYVIGAANLLGVRPTAISEVYLVDGNNVSYYQQIISADQMARLIYPSAPGRPDRVYLNFNETTIEATFYPTPSYADNCHIWYLNPMQTSGAGGVGTVLSMPPGYEEAFVYNFAIRIGQYYGRPMQDQTIMDRAMWSKSVVAQQNANTYLLQNPMPTQKRRFFNILTGGTI